MKRPEIPLPKTFPTDSRGWTDSDPKLQAILNDGKEALRAKYAAIIEADPESNAVAFYNVGRRPESPPVSGSSSLT